jgi:hypothetical protein
MWLWHQGLDRFADMALHINGIGKGRNDAGHCKEERHGLQAAQGPHRFIRSSPFQLTLKIAFCTHVGLFFNTPGREPGGMSKYVTSSDVCLSSFNHDNQCCSQFVLPDTDTRGTKDI